MRTPILAALSLTAVACQAISSPDVVDGDSVKREALFAAVSSLEGKWQGEGPDGNPSYTVFEVSSANSAVRETMLPDTEYEMTNMYTLDGDELVMTHYCAGGNQPTMRAGSLEDGRLVFHFEAVRDLKATDEVYMGEMTLVLIDENTIEQHWRALKNGAVDHDMVMALKRVN